MSDEQRWHMTSEARETVERIEAENPPPMVVGWRADGRPGDPSAGCHISIYADAEHDELGVSLRSGIVAESGDVTWYA